MASKQAMEDTLCGATSSFFKELVKYGFLCVDCKFDTFRNEYYMVKHRVWKKSGLARHGGMLCIGCLEQRIGRTLTTDDFLRCPLNTSIRNGHEPASARLLSRIRNFPAVEVA